MADPYAGPSPDDVAFNRRMAQQLMGQGMDTSPVGHWTQAIARVLQGGVGGMHQSQAAAGERQGTASIVNMLQGRDQPTASQLVSNPWTRDIGMKVIAERMKGADYGKQTTIVQDAQGNYHTLHTNNRGESITRPLQVGGGNAQSVTSVGEDGKQTVIRPTPLQPAKGVERTGDELTDKMTGRTVRNVAPQIAGEKTAQELGEGQGKFITTFPKAAMALESLNAKNTLVKDEISEAKKLIKGSTTGIAGAVMRGVPGTDAYALKQRITTILGNIGFEELQQMRAESPTGGALGAIAVQELTYLQAVRGSLEQAQSKEDLVRILGRLENFMDAAADRRKRGFDFDVKRFSGGQLGGQPPAPPNPVLDKNQGRLLPEGPQAAPLPARRMRFNPVTQDFE